MSVVYINQFGQMFGQNDYDWCSMTVDQIIRSSVSRDNINHRLLKNMPTVTCFHGQGQSCSHLTSHLKTSDFPKEGVWLEGVLRSTLRAIINPLGRI